MTDSWLAIDGVHESMRLDAPDCPDTPLLPMVDCILWLVVGIMLGLAVKRWWK